jgi:predicted negative regulator of RcsB-dependent stress response
LKHTVPAEVADAMTWVREYGVSAGIGIAVAVALALGIVLYRQQQSRTTARAAEILMNAKSADEMQQVVDQYGKTPSAPLALISMAGERFHEGRYDVAMAQYQQFLATYPDHPLRFAAQLGQAYCREALELWDAALEGYRTFAERNADHLLAPMAKFGEARVLAQMGQRQDAAAIYQAYVEGEENAPWRAQAQTALLYLEKDMRAAAAQPVATP